MVMIRRVIGASMLPTLRQGNIVVARKKSPKAGDIVIATVGDREVIKRVTKLVAGKLHLQGDNTLASTDSRQYGPITSNDVLGVVWFIIKT